MLLDPLSKLSSESLSDDSRARFTVPLRLLKLLFELSYLFRQLCYLIGISTSWFVPGFLCRVEGFRQPVLLAAVLVEPTTLCGVVGYERFAHSFATFAKLVGTSLLGELQPIPKRTTVEDRRVLNSK